MSSLDMSVEDHDHYNSDEDGIPVKCWCMGSAVLDMQKTGNNAGRMCYRCGNKDAEKGGHLFRWFETAVYYEFQKVRRELIQIRRLTEFNDTSSSRVADNDIAVPNPRLALLEEAHDKLMEEVRMLKEELARERRRLVLMLVCLGVSLNHDGIRGGGASSSS